MMAAGPFSLGGDLDYQPLQSLLELCKQNRPDILLLLGPFVDAEHSQIQHGLIDQAFQDLFEEKVSCPFPQPGSPFGSGHAAFPISRCEQEMGRQPLFVTMKLHS